MSDQYEEDKPRHLTQEPDEVPCYEDLETRIEELETENAELKAKLAWAVKVLRFLKSEIRADRRQG